jgi:hypothetical protein
MPKIEQTIANVNARSHTLAFITPKMTEGFKIPKSTAWAREALRTWSGVSPWRGDNRN